MKHVFIICLLLFLCMPPILLKKEYNNAENDLDTLKLIQQSAGRDIKLKCGIRNNHTEYLEDSTVQWYFKHCGVGFNKTSCQDNNEFTKWITLPCKRLTFVIFNSSENDSGLYRCTIHPKITYLIQIIRTFHLEIIDPKVYPLELIVDFLPSNTTAVLNSQVVLQCRVHSKDIPSIKWLRKQDASTQLSSIDSDKTNQNIIQYLESTYELLESAGEKELSEDIYLSKLIINNVSERDKGFYICIGINLKGYKLKEAYLNIIYPETQESSTKGLLLLFLIPVAFGCIPLFIWICFICRRSKQKNYTKNYLKCTRNNNNSFKNINVTRV